jgi:hypothetical protein
MCSLALAWFGDVSAAPNPSMEEPAPYPRPEMVRAQHCCRSHWWKQADATAPAATATADFDGTDFEAEEAKWREPRPDPAPKLGDGMPRSTALSSADDDTWTYYRRRIPIGVYTFRKKNMQF